MKLSVMKLKNQVNFKFYRSINLSVVSNYFFDHTALKIIFNCHNTKLFLPTKNKLITLPTSCCVLIIY